VNPNESAQHADQLDFESQLATRMMLRVQILQTLSGHVGVNGGGGNIGMS
jgi:hypothetical protein